MSLASLAVHRHHRDATLAEQPLTPGIVGVDDARTAWSGVNSELFASKYASIVPW